MRGIARKTQRNRSGEAVANHKQEAPASCVCMRACATALADRCRSARAPNPRPQPGLKSCGSAHEREDEGADSGRTGSGSIIRPDCPSAASAAGDWLIPFYSRPPVVSRPPADGRPERPWCELACSGPSVREMEYPRPQVASRRRSEALPPSARGVAFACGDVEGTLGIDAASVVRPNV
jgi:hypothetical protein